MNRSYLYNVLKERKVIICVIFGLLFLLIALAITYNYFGIRDFDKSKLIHFSENLANGLQDRESMEQWLFAKRDSLELWLKAEFEERKLNVIQKVVRYLETHVPWWRVWLTIISFIATCLFIFEFFRNKIAQIVGEERAPFSWKLDTGIISKFRNLNNWKPIIDYFGDGITSWAEEKMTLAKEKIGKLADEEISRIFATGLIDQEIENVISDGIHIELSKSSLLFLIDRISPHDHFAQFWAVATQELVANGIPTNFYFFNGDPRLCFSELKTQGISLTGLAELHPDSILVVIGDGNLLIKPDECQLRSWTTAFHKWETRFIFSPRNYFAWGKREILLKQLFHVLPAKFSSLNYLDDKPNAAYSINFQIETHTAEHNIDYEQDVFNEFNLHKYFGSSLQIIGEPEVEKKTNSQPILDWICSCAFHKNLDFQLSLELGKANFDRFEDAKFTPETILLVFQLPWFRTGKIDENTRVAIVKKFEEKSTDAAAHIRKFLKIKWPKWRPPEDSFASDTFSEAEQINEWKIKDPQPDSVTKHRIKNELNKVYDRGIEPDRILNVTDGIHNRYSKYFHPRLRPLIFNHGYSGLGLTQRFKNILYSLLAGLLLFLIYCIIIWLSRPMSGPNICPDCPPSIYSCAPITQTIGASQDHQKKIILTGQSNRPLLAYVTGYAKDCCVPLQIRGSDVTLMISKDTIGWLPGDTIPVIRQLGQGETLRMEIRDHIAITASDSLLLTVFVPLFDSVQVQTINLKQDSIVSDQLNRFVVTFSEADQICTNLTGKLKQRREIRKDTLFHSVWPDTSLFIYDVESLRPDTTIIIREFNERLTRFIYESRFIAHQDTIRIYSDSTNTQKIQILPCPECPEIPSDSMVVNIACIGSDLNTFMSRPTLILNNKVIVSPQNFVNPVKIPYELITAPSLKFTLSPPHLFRSKDSVLIKQFNPKNRLIDLDIYDPSDKDSILQIKGDIIILDSKTNYTTKMNFADNSLILYHCWDNVLRDTIEHQNGYFCYDLKKFSFCGSRIQIEYQGAIFGSKLIRDYKVLVRCVNDVLCADYGSIGIKSDAGKSSNLSPCQDQ